MMQKRIAMFSVHTCPLAFEEGKETGGMNVYVMELSRELSKKGYYIDIFTRSQSQTQPKIVVINPFLRVIHLKAGPEKSVPKKEVIDYLQEFTESFITFITKEQLQYDLFHAHYYLSGIVGQKLKNVHFSTIPLIVTYHTLALMKNLVARDELEKEEKERIDAELQLVKEADSIIASSSSDKEYLQYLYNAPGEKIVVINPGVDTNLFKPIQKQLAKAHIHADKTHKIILFVGRIEPLKGIDVLLYATKILLSKNPNLQVCLWIVGGDVTQKPRLWSKELQKLEKLQKTLNITTVVKFVGQRSQHELPYYYNASELVIMPSHYESFGMAALEAMACGTPVITTNVSGIASLFDARHEKIITSVNNPLLLASQMEFLLTNEEEHQKMSNQVLQRVQDLQWNKVAKKVGLLYEKLLSF